MINAASPGCRKSAAYANFGSGGSTTGGENSSFTTETETDSSSSQPALNRSSTGTRTLSGIPSAQRLSFTEAKATFEQLQQQCSRGGVQRLGRRPSADPNALDEPVPSAISVNDDIPPIASANDRAYENSDLSLRNGPDVTGLNIRHFQKSLSELQPVRSVHTSGFVRERSCGRSSAALERKRVHFGSDSEDNGSVTVQVREYELETCSSQCSSRDPLANGRNRHRHTSTPSNVPVRHGDGGGLVEPLASTRKPCQPVVMRDSASPTFHTASTAYRPPTVDAQQPGEPLMQPQYPQQFYPPPPQAFEARQQRTNLPPPLAYRESLDLPSTRSARNYGARPGRLLQLRTDCDGITYYVLPNEPPPAGPPYRTNTDSIELIDDYPEPAPFLPPPSSRGQWQQWGRAEEPPKGASSSVFRSRLPRSRATDDQLGETTSPPYLRGQPTPASSVYPSQPMLLFETPSEQPERQAPTYLVVNPQTARPRPADLTHCFIDPQTGLRLYASADEVQRPFLVRAPQRVAYEQPGRWRYVPCEEDTLEPTVEEANRMYYSRAGFQQPPPYGYVDAAYQPVDNRPLQAVPKRRQMDSYKVPKRNEQGEQAPYYVPVPPSEYYAGPLESEAEEVPEQGDVEHPLYHSQRHGSSATINVAPAETPYYYPYPRATDMRNVRPVRESSAWPVPASMPNTVKAAQRLVRPSELQRRLGEVAMESSGGAKPSVFVSTGHHFGYGSGVGGKVPSS